MSNQVNERNYKHWITRYCDRGNCWIVVSKLGDMIRHENTIITGPNGENILHEDLHLTHDNLQYVYLVNFSPKQLITLVQDDKYFYLINNIEITKQEGNNEVTDYESTIICNNSLSGLVAGLPKPMRKKLKLKTSDKIKLKHTDRIQLDRIVPIDFIGKRHIEQVKLFRDYCKQDADVLDLSGLFLLSPKVIEDTAIFSKKIFSHTQVILYQNNQFNKFGWLKHFPHIKILAMWYITTVTNDDIDLLVESAPNLETLEFHHCFQLNGRILIPISTLVRLDKLIINYERCDLQKEIFETIIKDNEWELIKNTNMSVVLIDSHNLTLDFIDFFLKSFKGINHFIMNKMVLDKLKNNSADGFKDREEPISFHSSEDTNIGFKRNRDVRIYDLVRNKCGNVFSESMLNLIKERSPDKADAADLLLRETTSCTSTAS